MVVLPPLGEAVSGSDVHAFAETLPQQKPSLLTEKRLRVLVAREAGLDLVAAAVVETHRQRLLRTAVERAHDERGALRHHFARLAGP